MPAAGEPGRDQTNKNKNTHDKAGPQPALNMKGSAKHPALLEARAFESVMHMKVNLFFWPFGQIF